MLLSDQATADLLKESVVAGWHEVRPVPKVTIDFGNGKTLKRTLAGNTVMYLCLPDGTVVDAYPGVYNPTDFAAVLKPGLWAAKNAMSMSPDSRGDFLAKWHADSVEGLRSAEQTRVSMAKAFIESPLLKALAVGPGITISPSRIAATTVGKAAVESPVLRAANLTVTAPDFGTYAARLEDISKSPSSVDRIKRELGIPSNATGDELARRLVELDSRTNLTLIHPGIHILLMNSGLKQPNELTPQIYKEMLHVDIDDPFLGIRDATLPGTPDR